MDQEPFGFLSAEPAATPVTVNMQFITETALDEVWIAYLPLPYKDILEFTESGDPIVLGKALGLNLSRFMNRDYQDLYKPTVCPSNDSASMLIYQ